MPPSDVDAERSILGCFLIDSDTFGEVDGVLQPKDFYDSQNRIVFSAIDRLQVSGEPFDAGSVGIELRRCDQEDEIGGLPYLNELMESVPHAYHADTYARRVRDQSKQRQLMYAGQRIAAEAAKPGMTVEHVQELIDGIGELFDDKTTNGKRFTTYNAAALASGDFRTEYHIPGN
jgi:replicative DNA helicase